MISRFTNRPKIPFKDKVPGLFLRNKVYTIPVAYSQIPNRGSLSIGKAVAKLSQDHTYTVLQNF